MQTSLTRSIGSILIVGALAAAIAVFNLPFFNESLRNSFYSAAAPLQRGVWVAGAQASGFFSSFARANTAGVENENLRKRVTELTARAALMEEVKRENDFLRQSLNLDLGKEYDLKMADIIGKLVSEDRLLINKGSRDLVEAGMPVITSEKAAVGKVSKVYDNFSEVELITGKSFSFDVKIGDAGVDGLARGRGEMSAGVDLVPKDKEIRGGDVVTTSRMGGIFPAGLVVGRVKDVTKNDVETFQSASIELAFGIGTASRVFIANEKYPGILQAALPEAKKK
ncbi:MAG: rod shape-determining protein MreC [Candidatus Pacebacteria bacterium]|jgi:rod shape-determining protein MreC|nr:rod shape-determining protein MreC [Candidatus Paceibacterota bacterium]